MSQSRFQTLLLLIIILMIFPWANPVLAENIDPLNEGLHYAYGENVGWINFKPSQGPGVTVTGSAVTGYAWGENIGWINLSPANAGVNNNGAGILSGYAWGENIGWINFSPAGGGVYIDENGNFIGRAWGENIGWITFNSTGAVSFGVKTLWKGNPISIPTLNEWGMIIFVVLAGLGSVYYLRRQRRA